MGALTCIEAHDVIPGIGKKTILVVTPATADSGDTIDLTDSSKTSGPVLATIDFLICWDQTTGDIVTATDSSGTVTLDASGSTTDHVYAVLAMGE